ncbi:hypothetical protein BDY24DRAFT_403851 [Mrakia frigida]|uniref:Arc1p n=1 Tax=Mrakia frigida TaxID=29902 RepID=UPI003FCBF6C2
MTTSIQTAKVQTLVAAAGAVLPAPSKDQDLVEEWVKKVEAEGAGDLKDLDKRLTPLTYLFNSELTVADVATYGVLHPIFAVQPSSEYYITPSVTRYLSHIQSHPLLASILTSSDPIPPSFPPITFDLDNLPAIERKAAQAKEKKPKKPVVAAAEETAKTTVETVTEKIGELGVAAQAAVGTVGAAVAGLGEKVKEMTIGGGEGAKAAPVDAEGKPFNTKKKEKKARPAAPAAPEPTGPMPSMIDLRVGHILSVAKHPDADSLYVEQVDVGEAEPRTIVSGLVNYMSIDEVKDKWIVVVLNMKPVAMRGIKSYSMVLCASSADGKDGGIEFVQPPPNSKPGERIYFEGEKYENALPLDVLNPKKKVFETIQPGFTTLPSLEAAWVDKANGGEVHRIRTKDGFCTVKKFVGASLS